ncbi:MAG: cupin domain-containing protein [bacterium]
MRPVALGVALLLAGCAGRRVLLLPDPPRRTSVGAMLAANPLAREQNIRPIEIAHGTESSVSLIQIRDREAPHIHTRYDLTVFLVEGHGVLWLDNTPQPMRSGDVAFVPKDTPHFFINEGDNPASALVSFAPAFNGPDQQPVPGP